MKTLQRSALAIGLVLATMHVQAMDVCGSQTAT